MEAAKLPVNFYAVLSFIGYLVLIALIGVLSSKFSSAGIGEFFLGGRRMPRFAVALSAVASGRSAWLLIGVSGMAFAMGASALWAVVGYTIMEAYLFFYLAPRLRRYTERRDCITLPDYFEARLADRSGAVRIVSVVIITVFMVAYVSAQFAAGGKTFAASFNLSQDAGIALTAGIVLFYTLLGGFLAVLLTDTLQGIMMLFSLLAVPLIVVLKEPAVAQKLSEALKEGLSIVDPFAIGTGVLLGYIGIGLGSPGNPHIVVRYMSIKKPEQLKYAGWIATLWNVLMGWAAVWIGLLGRLLYESASRLPGGDQEQLFPYMASQFLHPVLFGMVVSAIMAAIMSTADSQLLVASSALTKDIYLRFIKKEQDRRRMVLLSRASVLLMVIVAWALCYVARDLIFWLVLFAWGGLGASFGPVLFLSVFWKRFTKEGAIASMITGFLTVFLWKGFGLNKLVYELIPAFLLALAAGVVFSLFSGRDRLKELEAEFKLHL